jgi:hypothetical protein
MIVIDKREQTVWTNNIIKNVNIPETLNMQHKRNLLQRVHLTSSINSKTQRRCARVHSVQFCCILFISAFSVEIRPRALKVLTEICAGEMLDSEADVALSKEEV